MKHLTLLTILLTFLLTFLLASALAAQAASVIVFDPMPQVTHIIGSAQMDQDPAEEIVVLDGESRLMIIDSASGAVEFDSDGYGWSYVYPPGFNRQNGIDNYAGHNYGFDAFVDDDGDGIFCLMSIISEQTIYEQQVAVICLRQPPTGIEEITPKRSSSLDQSHPNPFNPNTTINYDLASNGRAVIRIYDARGALVRTLIDAVQSAGPKSVRWDGTDDGGSKVASGTYFYQLETDEGMLSRKTVLLK